MSIDPLTLIDHSLSYQILITFTINLPSHSNPKKQLYEAKQVNYGKLKNELQRGRFTQELKELINERDKKYVLTRRYINTHRSEVEFADLKRRVKNLIEYNKKEHFKSKLKDCERSMKKTWDTMKEMTGQMEKEITVIS
ncbi:hypothetical protein HHI36_018380 [Cryptolaemus montrouzieri]|uniref:Uncharacterized protein n=1 Tax=Cryptolaemus montrouzieri TaxID=559131 RepID=A0ABD2P0N9_9CUCU